MKSHKNKSFSALGIGPDFFFGTEEVLPKIHRVLKKKLLEAVTVVILREFFTYM